MEPQKWQKWYFWNFYILQNWFHVKSDWQKNPEISTLWNRWRVFTLFVLSYLAVFLITKVPLSWHFSKLLLLEKYNFHFLQNFYFFLSSFWIMSSDNLEKWSLFVESSCTCSYESSSMSNFLGKICWILFSRDSRIKCTAGCAKIVFLTANAKPFNSQTRPFLFQKETAIHFKYFIKIYINKFECSKLSDYVLLLLICRAHFTFCNKLSLSFLQSYSS